MNEDTERRRNTLVENLRKQLKEEFLAGFKEGCNAASFVRCKDCRSFLPVCIPEEHYADTDPKSMFVQTIKVCMKGHNGYETFGCTEGEPKEE